MDNLVPELVSTIQSTSIQHNPDADYDLNPSTSASAKLPVTISDSYAELDPSDLDPSNDLSPTSSRTSSIPTATLEPLPRKRNLPPLPDMRFEQSYLKSIEHTDSPYTIAYITIRDQVLLPLFQGTLYSLAVLGWRFWNRNASVSGAGWGSRARRWWYETNNWELPGLGGGRSGKGKGREFARQVGEVSFGVWDPANGA